MPRGDGTGPRGEGAGTGRGMKGSGVGQGKGGGLAAGPGGDCVCTGCGKKMRHQPGRPCYEQKCPECGSVMTRE